MYFYSISIEQIIYVPSNGTLEIVLPAFFTKQKSVKVTIDNVTENLEHKIALMKKAATDTYFHADTAEIANNFNFIDLIIN